MSLEERISLVGGFGEASFTGYSLVQAFENSDENIFRVLQSLAKAELFCNSEHETFFSDVHQDESLQLVDRNPFYLTLPLLVVDTPLFYSYLGQDKKLELMATEWATVDVKPYWEKPKRYQDEVCNIQIVTRNYLQNFVEEVNRILNYLSSEDVVHPIPQSKERIVIEKKESSRHD